MWMIGIAQSRRPNLICVFLLSRTLGREFFLTCRSHSISFIGAQGFKIVSGTFHVHLLHLLAPLALVYRRDTLASCVPCFRCCVLSLVDPPPPPQ